MGQKMKILVFGIQGLISNLNYSRRTPYKYYPCLSDVAYKGGLQWLQRKVWVIGLYRNSGSCAAQMGEALPTLWIEVSQMAPQELG